MRKGNLMADYSGAYEGGAGPFHYPGSDGKTLCGREGLVTSQKQRVQCQHCLVHIFNEPLKKPQPQSEMVVHPNHYGGGDNPHETIKCLKAWGLEEQALLWNAAKYISRAGKKHADKEIEDLEKSYFYLGQRIADLKAARGDVQ